MANQKQTYILLADIQFDWSVGEYSSNGVSDIYLGHGDFNSIDEAQAKADALLVAYVEANYMVDRDLEYTYAHVKPIEDNY